ncbi:MAG: hypothetical protein FWE36_06875 [Erysipelotrichales bacterium]|nr:hypothetical protein [Erysipelotrichales bacterium]
MIIKYSYARLKQSKAITLSSAIVLSLIVLAVMILFTMSSIFKHGMINFQRQLSGDADIVLTSAADRFFGLSALREDDILKDNSLYIHGFLRTFAQVERAEGANDFSTIFAADFDSLQQFNAIRAHYLPSFLIDTDIIISNSYARERGLLVGDSLTLSLGGRRAVYQIVAIAENEGIFYSGNAIYMTHRALARILPFLGSGIFIATDIVNYAFIKANDLESLSLIEERLKTNFSHLNVTEAVDFLYIENVVSRFTEPVIVVSLIASVFCVISLLVLLRLMFAKDRKNFLLLKMLGMSKKGIALITILTGLIIAVLGFIGALLFSKLLIFIMGQALPLFSGYNLGFLTVLIAVSVALFGGIGCALLCARVTIEEKVIKKSNMTKGIKAIIVLVLSGFSAISALLIIRNYPFIALVLIVISLIAIIVTMPKVITIGANFWHKKKANIYTLRFQTLSQAISWQRFSLFITLGVLVILTSMSASYTLNNNFNAQMNYPFEIVVTEISAPNQNLVERIAETEGVSEAIKAQLHLGARIYLNDNYIYSNLLALEDKGFAYFGADFTLINGIGVAVGRQFAIRNSLELDSEIVFSGRENISFRIVEILDTEYLNGNFILADLAKVVANARPFSEILIATNESTALVLSNVNSAIAALGASASALEISALASFMQQWYIEFVWLFNIFIFSIAAVAALTSFLMIFLRRKSNLEETRRLKLIGLSNSADIKQNLFSLFFGLLPIFIILPILMFLIAQASLPLFMIFGSYRDMHYNLLMVSLTVLGSFSFVLVVESIITWKFKVS